MNALARAAAATVLVVDDDFDVRDTISDVLRDAGYLVLSAADGIEALALMRRGPLPDIVVLDLMMPNMNGYEFRAAQRLDPQLAAVPVVVLTADRQVHGRQHELQAAAYLVKPTRIDDLLAAVERLT